MTLFPKNEVRGGHAGFGVGVQMFPDTKSFRLTDPEHGRLVEEIAKLDDLGVARVRSTGHQISLVENRNLTYISLKSGRLEVETSSRSLAASNSGGLLFTPNRRSTRVVPAGATCFNASVLLASERTVLEEVERAGLRAVRGSVECEFEPRRPSRAFLSLQRCLDYLVDELSQPDSLLADPRVQKRARGLAMEQLIHLLQHCGGLADGDSKAPASKRMVRAAEDYMQEHFAHIGSMSEVAQAVGVGLRCLQASFKATTNRTPRQALVRVRLERTREALLCAEKGATVSTVALDCGFTHFGRFSAQYRAAFNESPSVTLGRTLAR